MANLVNRCRIALFAVALTLPMLPVLPTTARAVEAQQATQTKPKGADKSADKSTAKSTEKPAPTPAQLAARERMKTCGTEWRALKASGKAGNQTWREFSSTCLKQAKR